MKKLSGVLFCLVVIDLPYFLYACNGYEYKLHYFKPCNDDDKNVLKLTNVDNKIDANCNIIPFGCVSTEGFKSAMLHYRVEKKPMPILEGDFDLCKGMENKEEFALFGAKLLSLPDSCPVPKYDSCGDGKKGIINISKFKNKLGLAVGKTVVNLTLKHENGESCYTLLAEFKKVRKLG